MAKKIVGFIKLQVPAGKANPSPPIGPALGQRGLNIMEFCHAFNAQTQAIEPGLKLPVVITAYADKSFSFVLKSPPATVLLKKAVKLFSAGDLPLVGRVEVDAHNVEVTRVAAQFGTAASGNHVPRLELALVLGARSIGRFATRRHDVDERFGEDQPRARVDVPDCFGAGDDGADQLAFQFAVASPRVPIDQLAAGRPARE